MTTTELPTSNSFIECKKAAVRSLRKAQSRIELRKWNEVATLIEEARNNAAQCALLDGRGEVEDR